MAQLMRMIEMPIDGFGVWTPLPEHMERSNVAGLIRRLRCKDYDELYHLSIEQPERYWAEILDICGVKWTNDYQQFCDLERGPAFAQWFTEGRLNWTDTIFAWAKDPATQDRIAVIAENEAGVVERLTFAELHNQVRCFAAGLRSLGLARGDRAGLLMEPGVGAVISMIALSYIGIVVLPLFSGFGAEPIASRLELCGARALVATTGFYRRGKWIDCAETVCQVARSANLEFLILRDAQGRVPDDRSAIDWHSLARAEPVGPDAEPMDSADPFMVFFTSGTTGKPKGIVHTHAGFPLKIAHDAFVHFDMQSGDVFFWPADMGWIAGALIIAGTLMHGATMVCYDGAYDAPDLSRMSRMIERHRITHFGTAPTMIRAFAASPDLALRGDVSSLRLLITGGESISAEHFIWFAQHFGGSIAPLVNYSGGTEASGALISSVPVLPILPASFNTASPGIDVDVVDGNGKPLRGDVGELVVRAPFVGMTRSFWQDDERYLDTYWRTIPGVWVHGDLAVRDDAGNFTIRGRSDDTIKLAGKRTGPAEIEDVLLELPGTIELAAIGVDDPAKGQILVVFAVCKGDDDSAGIVDAIIQHADKRLGRAFRPARVHVVKELPKTKTGKIMRRVIRSVYCGLPPGDVSAVENLRSLDEIARVAA